MSNLVVRQLHPLSSVGSNPTIVIFSVFLMLYSKYTFPVSLRRQRRVYYNNEIFFGSCNLLKQSRFSNNLRYFSFKRKLFFVFQSTIINRCTVTGSTKNVYSKFKQSRHSFLRRILQAKFCGFFRAVW